MKAPAGWTPRFTSRHRAGVSLSWSVSFRATSRRFDRDGIDESCRKKCYCTEVPRTTNTTVAGVREGPPPIAELEAASSSRYCSAASTSKWTSFRI